MPEIKVTYRFNGDRRTFTETYVLHPDVNADRYFDTLNLEYNDEKPRHEPSREIVSLELLDAWKHQHSFARVPGFDYFQCEICDCKAIWSEKAKLFHRLQGWEDDKFEFCTERPPKLPPVKGSHLVISDIDVAELPQETRTGLKQISPIKL